MPTPYATTRPRRRTLQASLRETGPQQASILFVCTGNICRSAYAHHGLAQRIAAAGLSGHVEVTSAGTQPNQSLNVPDEIVALGAEREVNGLRTHTPQALHPRLARSADLILTATAGHLETVLRESPQMLSRSFTVFEFGALVSILDERTGGEWLTPGCGLATMARTASRHRVLARSAMTSLDLPDPFRQGNEAYRDMVETLDPILDTTTQALVRATAPST